MSNQSPKIIFLGTPEFAVPVLVALIKNDLAPVLVITQPDKPAGRNQELTPPSIKQVALKNNIPLAQPTNKKELREIFGKYQIDLGILVAFGMIMPKDILEKPKFGFLNLHPSLLPKYRGPSPIQASLLNGDQETGVSIIQLTPEVDAGPIVAQRNVEITSTDNGETLHDKLAKTGADLIVEILPDYLVGKLEPKPQDDSLATETEMIKRDDGQINWRKKALEIERQFRAFYPWPGLFTHLDKKRLKIANLAVLEGDLGVDLSPGEVFLGPNKELAVKCGDGAVSLISVQLEGKKEMPAQDFFQGQKDIVGKQL